MNSATQLPRPRVTLHANGDRLVTYPCGRSAKVWESKCGHETRGFYQLDDAEHGTSTWSADEAFAQAWAQVMPEPAPVDMDRAELAALIAEGCDNSRAFAKAVRKLLKLRTGFAWTAKCGRGTGSSWVNIMSAKKDTVDGDGHYMKGYHRALLGVILKIGGERGVIHFQGESVCPNRWDNGVNPWAWYLWRLAGVRPTDAEIGKRNDDAPARYTYMD